jgi:hypothetical protein
MTAPMPSRPPAPAARPPARSPNVALGLGCVTAFLLPFCAVGVGTAIGSARALLRHDLYTGGFLALFAVVFGGTGFTLLALAWRGRGAALDRARREQATPDEPWRWRPDWERGRIEDASRAGAWGAAAFAFLWNVISWPSVFIAFRHGVPPSKPGLYVILIFPAVGLLLLVGAARAAIRRAKYGTSVLQLRRTPAVVGRALEGDVAIAMDPPPGGFRVTLSCVRRERTGSGKDSSTTERILWQDVTDSVAPRREGYNRISVPVAIRLPADQPPADPVLGDNRVLWRLELHADTPGVDYDSSFEVPVFHTKESDEPAPPDADLPPPAPLGPPKHSKIVVTTRGTATVIHFPAARNAGAGLGITAFLAIWSGAVWLLLSLHVPIIFPLFFGLFELLLVYITLGVWLTTTDVTVEPGVLTVRSGYLGLGGARTIRATDVRDVTVANGMQSGSTVYYDLKVVDASGRRTSAGTMIRDRHEAEWLAQRIRDGLQSA